MNPKSWPLILLAASPLRAAFQSDFTSARAASLGGAVAARGQGAADLFTTPAALASLDGAELSFMYQKPFTDLGGLDAGEGFLALAAPSRWGSWGLGAAAFRAANATEERTLNVSYAAALAGDRFRAGASLKRLSHRYLISGTLAQNDPIFRNGDSKSATDVDLGFSAKCGGPWRAGLTVRNLRRADVGLVSQDRLRREVQGGLALEISSWGLKASGDFSLKTPAPGTPRRFQPAVGVEKFLYKDTFSLRAGANLDRFATGLGVRAGRISIDYALLFDRTASGSGASTHQVQMTCRFTNISR